MNNNNLENVFRDYSTYNLFGKIVYFPIVLVFVPICVIGDFICDILETVDRIGKK